MYQLTVNFENHKELLEKLNAILADESLENDISEECVIYDDNFDIEFI